MDCVYCVMAAGHFLPLFSYLVTLYETSGFEDCGSVMANIYWHKIAYIGTIFIINLNIFQKILSYVL